MRAAAIQLNTSDDPARALAAADRLVRAAAADGATLVVMPEKWTVLGSAEQLRAGAQTLEGEAVGWARAVAAELAIDLVAGSIAEQRSGHERLSNTSVHVGPDGRIHAAYRKIHLFDVDVAGTPYRESDTDEPGDEIVVSELADGTPLGMTICFDLRFPELYRILALRGARILAVPAAFTEKTTADHWEVLLRARAMENQAFVVAANQYGVHGDGKRSGGRSMIVGPWGEILAQAPADGEAVVLADLDLARQDELRATFPNLACRRPEAYRWPSEVHA